MNNAKKWLMAFVLCFIAGSVTNLANAMEPPKLLKQCQAECGMNMGNCAMGAMQGNAACHTECAGDAYCQKDCVLDSRVAISSCLIGHKKCLSGCRLIKEPPKLP